MASLPQRPQSPSDSVSESKGFSVDGFSSLFKSSIDTSPDSELSDTEHLNISYESPLFTQFSTFFDMVIDLIINEKTCYISPEVQQVLDVVRSDVLSDKKTIQAFCWHATTKRSSFTDQTVFAQEVATYVQTTFKNPIKHANEIKEHVHMLVMSTKKMLNNFTKDSEGAENFENGRNVSQIDIDPPEDKRHIENILDNIKEVLENQPMDLNNPYNMITRHPKTSDARDVICSTISVFNHYGYDGHVELFNQAHLQARYMFKLQSKKLNLSTTNLKTISQAFRIFNDDSSGMSKHDSTSDTSQTHTDSAAAANATTPLRIHTNSGAMSQHSTPTPSPEIRSPGPLNPVKFSPGPLNPVKLIFKARQRMSPNPKPRKISKISISKISKHNLTNLRF